mmetsp:Transcript_84776/g.133928  ORF Transcript_84776/g.133928 Transcript_84776/m.133928 type:complete len:99 (-) Transcript_84776:33-329(-)
MYPGHMIARRGFCSTAKAIAPRQTKRSCEVSKATTKHIQRLATIVMKTDGRSLRSFDFATSATLQHARQAVEMSSEIVAMKNLFNIKMVSQVMRMEVV